MRASDSNMRTLAPPWFHEITEAFTPDEIEKYSTYHWLVIGNTDEPNRYAHVWQTIAGRCRYLGTTEDIKAGREPAEQLPLIPTLDFEAVVAGGATPAEGGVVPYDNENPTGTTADPSSSKAGPS